MAQSSPLLGRLNAGELSPRLEGRPELDFYAAGFRTLENMIPLVQGATTRRPGTRFVKSVKTPANRTPLFPFVFSTAQAYILEPGDRYMRFFRDKARIDIPATDAAISNGDFTSNITGWTSRSTGGGSIAHDATNGRLSLLPGGTAATDIGWAEQAVSVGASYQSVLHVLVFRVLGARGDQIELRLGTSSTGAQLVGDKVCGVGWHAVSFTPGAATVYVQFRNKATTNNGITAQNKTLQIDDVSLIDDAPLELPTPYAQADLFYADDDPFNPKKPKIKICQSADVVYFLHPDYPEYRLSRTADASWSFTQVQHRDGPYLDENTTATTITPSAATGAGITLTASSATGINEGAGFMASDIGRLVRLKEGSTWGWCIITGHTSSTVVTADVLSTLTNTNAKAAWRLGLWSDTYGHAACATFHEERLIRAPGGTIRPQRFDGSISGDFDNFTPGTGDGDPLAYNIGSNDVATILWLASERSLLLGTPSGPFSVATDTTNGALTPTNARARRQSGDGCADAQPGLIGATLLFIQAMGRKLRELAYRLEVEGYRAPDLTVRADHLFAAAKQLLGICWQQEPFSAVWAARSDGMLTGFTYERDQEVLAWHRHPLAGTAAGAAAVEACAVIPGAAGDELWLVVNRTIGGATTRYVEVMEAPLGDDADQVHAWYVDSGLQYAGAATTTISGLGHLAGETVSLWTDKGVHRNLVVSAGGTLTLDFEITQAQIGLPMPWVLHTQRLEAGAEPGITAQTKKKRVARVAVRMLRSIGIKVGRDATNYFEIPPRTAQTNLGQAPQLRSDDYENAFNGTWDTDGGVRLFGDGPGPVTIVAIVPDIDTNAR
jgi:hypothetical protein